MLWMLSHSGTMSTTSFTFKVCDLNNISLLFPGSFSRNAELWSVYSRGPVFLPAGTETKVHAFYSVLFCMWAWCHPPVRSIHFWKSHTNIRWIVQLVLYWAIQLIAYCLGPFMPTGDAVCHAGGDNGEGHGSLRLSGSLDCRRRWL